MTSHVVLDELQPFAEVVELGSEEAVALGESGLVAVSPTPGGRWALLPVGTVGAVQIGKLLVEVKPKQKVGLGRLLFLLGYAKNPGFRPEDVDGVEDTDLFAALAESLARQTERALERGVLHGYVHVEEALRTVRGRIRAGDQMTRRPGLLLPLEVTYDDYTVDIAENRILRAALRLMMQVPRLSPEVLVRLKHLDTKLDGVAAVPMGDRVPPWVPTRLNDRYIPGLLLAEIVLQNMSAEAGVGSQSIASFVVSMATVFEDFVTTALREALGLYPGETKDQYPEVLDEAEPGYRPTDRVKMLVDVVHTVDGAPAMVFDAKYKAPSETNAPNADHYQMLAYCTALGVSKAWLVYAGPGGHRRRRVRNTGISIEEYRLDLSQTPRALLARVERLAEAAFQQRTAKALSLANT